MVLHALLCIVQVVSRGVLCIAVVDIVHEIIAKVPL